jgi:hypothetical protein
MKIVATLLVRDEEEIIAQTIEHHLSQGIDQFIVTDHMSKDSTLSIIRKFPEVTKIIREKEKTYNQFKWVTRMARMACDLNPDWIVHLDADEFWTGFECLKYVPENIVVVKSSTNIDPMESDGTTCREYLPIEGLKYGNFKKEDMPYFRYSNVDRISKGCKIVHRPSKKIKIKQGNHDAKEYEGQDGFTNEITIDHYPVRSYEHFLMKIKNGGLAYQTSKLHELIGHHWKRWYQNYLDGSLREEYEKMLIKKEDISRLLAENKIKNKLEEFPIKKSWIIPSL